MSSKEPGSLHHLRHEKKDFKEKSKATAPTALQKQFWKKQWNCTRAPKIRQKREK